MARVDGTHTASREPSIEMLQPLDAPLPLIDDFVAIPTHGFEVPPPMENQAPGSYSPKSRGRLPLECPRNRLVLTAGV